MNIRPAILEDVYLIDPEVVEDDRGFFARVVCSRTFEQFGLASTFVQSSVSFNRQRGTIRGMHYQTAPFEEVKLVRCTMGVVFDVFVDLRPDSPTYTQWEAVELSAENRRTLYIPNGFAHGFQTLTDKAEVHYQISEVYQPESQRGFAWNDPTFGITLPEPVSLVSPRDQQLPRFEKCAAS
ncbi:MAG: dTDP-4-dehydrorhamnose 3,5-epimerase [Candidatus Paceibacterota bacterium]